VFLLVRYTFHDKILIPSARVYKKKERKSIKKSSSGFHFLPICSWSCRFLFFVFFGPVVVFLWLYGYMNRLVGQIGQTLLASYYICFVLLGVLGRKLIKKSTCVWVVQKNTQKIKPKNPRRTSSLSFPFPFATGDGVGVGVAAGHKTTATKLNRKNFLGRRAGRRRLSIWKFISVAWENSMEWEMDGKGNSNLKFFEATF